jgi:hypothetical protein
MAANMRLPILPGDVAGDRDLLYEIPEDARPVFPPGATEHYGPSARWLLGALLASCGLARTDEIAIVTTFDETYVSTCLTVTAFNHAAVSRVVTEATRVVILVHEHGFVRPDVVEACRRWREDGILVVEDCAHLAGGKAVEGDAVGALGDHALYSLTKLAPVAGGLLRSWRPADVPSTDDRLDRPAIDRWIARLGGLAELRRTRAAILRHELAAVEDGTARADAPWMFRLRATASARSIVTGVEWGATLRDDLVLVPTNPLVEEAVFAEVGRELAACIVV